MSNRSESGNIIETTGLTKQYGTLKAVAQVSLSVQPGEIYGFLGLNGAGKTTTIRMLLGMIRPTAGKVYVWGKRILPGQQGPWDQVGYLVESSYSYPELTVKENLLAVSRLHGLKDPANTTRIINLLKLNAYENIKTRNLSQGNNQRLGLAKALLHEPTLLILDEPSNSLDPAGIVEIRELLKDYSGNRGITVFISSHNLSEISRLATRIGIIHQGTLVQEMATEKMDTVLRTTLHIDTRDRKGAALVLNQAGFNAEFSADTMIQIADAKACAQPEEINKLLVRAGFPPHYLNTVQEDLELYFLRITGGKTS